MCILRCFWTVQRSVLDNCSTLLHKRNRKISLKWSLFKPLWLTEQTSADWKLLWISKLNLFWAHVSHLHWLMASWNTVSLEFSTMPPRRPLTDAEGGMTIVWPNGVAVREVGRRLLVTHSVIQRQKDRLNGTGSVQELRRFGCPWLMTRQLDRYVLLSALRNRTAASNVLRGQLQAVTNVTISDQAVLNRLHAANMILRHLAVWPRLTRAHRAARLTWARRHLAWTNQQCRSKKSPGWTSLLNHLIWTRSNTFGTS